MRVGFVGLGAMGMHMARNLQKAGLLSGLYNRTADKALSLAAELKVSAYPSLPELGAAVDAVVSCVSADADVLEVARALAPCPAPRRPDARLLHHRRGERPAGRRHPASGRRGVSRLPGQRRGRGRARCHARHHGRRHERGLRAGPSDPRGPGQDRHALWPDRQRPGGQGHQPDHVRGHHRGDRRSHGLRPRPGTAARTS